MMRAFAGGGVPWAAFSLACGSAPGVTVERRRGQIVTVHKYVGLKPNASSRVSGELGRS